MYNYDKNQGSVLVILLGLILIILVITTGLTESVMSEYKSVAAHQDQVKSEQLSDYTQQVAQNLIFNQLLRPEVTTDISEYNNQQSANSIIVLADQTNQYNLQMVNDPITQTPVDWFQQPQAWWQDYAIEIPNELTNINDQQAYYIIAEKGEDLRGQDLSQAQHYYAPPKRVIFEVTSNAEGLNQGISRLQTLIAKTYYQ